MLVARNKEKTLLQGSLESEYSQFIAVYGRRRVGKTFLIRESFGYHFAFDWTSSLHISVTRSKTRG